MLSGQLDGSIVVDSSKDDVVRIILNNVSIKSTDGPAIYIKQSDRTIITLDEDSNNTLADCQTYSDAEADSTIYSKDDICFNGYGSLEVYGNYQDAIVGKDDLKIVSGTYNIVSMNNGIKGKDSVEINDGTFTINAQNDGVKSTNSDDSEKGFINIENGIFNIEAEHDGIQAENYINIENGTFKIISGGGSQNSTKVGQQTDIFIRGQWNNTVTQEDTGSYKGIKSVNSINIQNGEFDIDSADDAIHCNSDIEMNGGNFEISSGDDGVHADNSIYIHESQINITKSYEGIEASLITIDSGNIEIVSSDDGINIAGGNDSSSFMGRPGQNTFSNNSDCYLTINGGNIYVNAGGDGLDANGSIYINSGNVYVDGPTDGGNSALDYDGEFLVNGGTLIAVGSSQMAQSISQDSSVNGIDVNLNTSSSGAISVVNSSGEEIISYSPSKSYQNIIIGTNLFENNETYELLINGEVYTSFTVSDGINNIGNNFQNQNMRRF